MIKTTTKQKQARLVVSSILLATVLGLAGFALLQPTRMQATAYADVTSAMQLPNPTPPLGYEFAGWYLDAELTIPFDGMPITEDMTLHARFEVAVFTVQLNLNGGALNEPPPTTFTIYDHVVLPVPTRAGFRFVRWGMTGQGSTAFVEIPVGSVGNRTFNAIWTVFRPRLGFMVGESLHYSMNVDYRTTMTAHGNRDIVVGGSGNVDRMLVRTLERRACENWQIDLTRGSELWDVDLPTNRRESTDHRWLSFLIQGTYFADNSNPYVYHIIVMRGLETTPPQTRDGVIMERGANRSSVQSQFSGIAHGERFLHTSSFWGGFDQGNPIGQYTAFIAYRRDGHTIGDYLFSEAFVQFEILPSALQYIWPLPVDPRAQRGYEFVGWYLNDTFTQPLASTEIRTDMAIHARFVPIVYSLTFILNGGNALVSPPVGFTVNDTIVLPTPTRLGHNFGGWYDNSGFAGQAVAQITNTANDVTVYARWDIMRFTITLVVDGVVYRTILVEWGTELGAFTFIDPLTGQLAIFYRDSNLTDSICQSTVIDRDMVVYSATPTDIFVTLTYNIAGRITTHLVPHGERIGDIAAELEGHVFVGWYRDSSFTMRITSNDRFTNDTTIYARFVEVEELLPTPWERSRPYLVGGTVGIITLVAVASVVAIIKKKRSGG